MPFEQPPSELCLPRSLLYFAPQAIGFFGLATAVGVDSTPIPQVVSYHRVDVS